MPLHRLGIVAAVALASVTAPVRADPVEEKNVLSGKTKMAADKGYIYIEWTDRFFGTFLRVPDEATRAEYQQDWEKAFVEAQKRYRRQLDRWAIDVQVAERVKKKPPEKPEEPTRETFTIEAIDLRDAVSFGPMFVYAKSDTRVSYLNEVKPGTYIWYGPVLAAPGLPAGGTCACMGTVRFEVKPGLVTDLGNFLSAAPQADRNFDFATRYAWEHAEEKAAKSGKPLERPDANRPAVAFGLPDSLKAWGSVQPEFHASGKLNNYYGISMSRLAPIPGVLAYRRDTVVDARTNTDVPNPRIVTQAWIKK